MSVVTHLPVGREGETWSFAIRDRAIVAFVSILVFVPSALFATALRPIPALAVMAGCVGALSLLVWQTTTARTDGLGAPANLPRLAACVTLAFAIFLLGGETHLFFSTPDWLIRDAVLADLVRHGFPVAYRVGDADYLLRAPLGMYMLPAVVGRALGLFAAHMTLLVQNALFLGAIFYLMWSMGRGWRHLAVLILFAGLSWVGVLLRLASQQKPGVPFWLQWGLDGWHPLFQYSGSIVQFFWVPNHALPGWWLATLFLLQRRSSIDLATIGVSIAGLCFWSPLAIVPAVPWLLYSAVTNWRSILSPRIWIGLAAAACFLPILAYLVAASGSIAHGRTLDDPHFAFWYALFILLQLPALIFLAIFWRHVPRELRALVVVNALVLLALPCIHFGPRNDLVMRGSIASLAIVAFAFGSVLVELTDKRAIGAVAGWMLVLATLPSAVVEIGRALSTPRYALSACSLMEASRATGDSGVPTNYVAPRDSVPRWLLDADAASGVPIERRSCWPDLRPASWFGFALTRRDGTAFTRHQLLLDLKVITFYPLNHRYVFGGSQ